MKGESDSLWEGYSDARVVVAALSIPVPTARFADREWRLAETLLRSCAEVSATLGAKYPHAALLVSSRDTSRSDRVASRL